MPEGSRAIKNGSPHLWTRMALSLAVWALIAFAAPVWLPELGWDPAGPDTLLAAILVGVTWFYAAETSQMRAAGRTQVEIAEAEHRLRRPHLAANIATQSGKLALEIVNVGAAAALDVDIKVQFFDSADPSRYLPEQHSPTLGTLLPHDRVQFDHPEGLHVETELDESVLGKVAYSGLYRTPSGDTIPIARTELDIERYMGQLRTSKMRRIVQ